MILPGFFVLSIIHSNWGFSAGGRDISFVPMNKILILAASTLILYSCKKNGGNSGGSNPPPNDTAKCVLTGETTTLLGNEASWTYEYNDKGIPVKITKRNRYDQIESTTDISSSGTTILRDQNKIGTSYNYNNAQGDIFAGYPTSSDVSITIGTLEQRNYYHYTFGYDAKHRLTGVSEHTNTVTNDNEWDLTVSYDDHDNVTGLRYEWSTGPRNEITIIKATAYDDKPTPYAGVKGWKFLSSFAWDNYDPEPILTALSAHNPVEFTMGTTDHPNQEHRTITYTYNEKGFPLERANKHNNRGTESNWKQTFTYNCK